MKFKLIGDNNIKQNPIITVLHNRGIEDIEHYINTTDEDINRPDLLGVTALTTAAARLTLAISRNEKILVIVDADCDGYTSSAILINYLHSIFPAFVENNLDYYIHSGKQHGLSDCIEIALKYNLVICPDSSSNDYEYHKILAEKGIKVIVLDHHEADHISENAIVINNQLSDYPNKDFSGAGVTWQFCRFLDSLLNKNKADDYLDLVALGNMADMMSLRSKETKHLIWKGFQYENIRNPFIFEMSEKNNFSLNKPDYKSYYGLKITPMGSAFFIAPFVNAMVRSGTKEEKELLFKSMLQYEAFKKIPSTKRGHSFGEEERLVDQAIRTCVNVKNRQTRAQDAGMEKLEGLIEKNNMMQHKVLLFLLDPGIIDRNIAGLVANKIMAKYQRPTCILTKVIDESGNISYQGSARGYDKSGFTHFKDICANSSSCLFAEGHQGAFGLGLGSDYPGAEEVFGDWYYQFIDYTDEALKEMSDEPLYYIDYYLHEKELDPDIILKIAEMNDFWGKDLDRSYIGVNFKVNSDNFSIMKGNTLKFILPNGITAIKFGGTEEEIETLSNRPVEIDAICKCNINEWNGFVNAQLLIEDYEIVDKKEQSAIDNWGF